MVSTYHGIETGQRAISFFRKSMEVAGINTSKAKEEGYSRQVVNVTASQALSTNVNFSMLGTGVEITSIQRMRDQYLDNRLRRANVEQTYWSTMVGGMTRVNNFITNINEKGLNNCLDDFWGTLQDVHINPGSAAVRGVALESADTLTQFSTNLYNTYNAYRDELNEDIRAMVEEANSFIDQIAIINRGIRDLVDAGHDANPLLDKRDLLVDKLITLTGATATTMQDEFDNDFKVMIQGRIIIQGTKTRHLMLVENEFNRNYFDVQIEYNQYDISSNTDAVGVVLEQRADDLREINSTCTLDGFHQIEVVRTADEMYWQVGHALGAIDGGERLDGIKSPNVALGLNGSFALQVGTRGVRAYSEVFAANPPGVGVILGPVDTATDAPTKYQFRVMAGDFETTISLDWDDTAKNWEMSDNLGNGPDGITDLTVSAFADKFNAWYGASGVTARDVDDALVFESVDRNILSITDLVGDLTRSSGLANENPVVRIDVTEADTLQTIANKINNAYMFDKIVQIEGSGEDAVTKRLLQYETVPADTAPSKPEQWLHATVETDEKGDSYLLLTSNEAGEANRINVLSGAVCGDGTSDMTIARLLGLVQSDPPTNQDDITSYIQVDAEGNITSRYTEGGDVFVDDAYVILDGKKEFLSSTNAFKDARLIAAVGEAPADELSEFSPGMRVYVTGVGESDIIVRHHLTEGSIIAAVKLRDDELLKQMDRFDEIMYELASEFNAVHYAGYGTGDYENISGLGFFERIGGTYGAFGKLQIQSDIISEGVYEPSRLAAMSGDGSGHNIGHGDGSNALAMAQLKQAKLFMGGTATFDDVYKDFVAEYASFGARAKTMLDNANHITEQIANERASIMGVNVDEEMLTLTQMNQQFNYASQYISTMFQVMDQIISGLGRVGL